MDLPKVSVLIPTYNQPESLKRALNSLIIQTFQDFEVVITDDSDNDEVLNVAKEYSHLLKLKYFKNTVRLGSPRNWNEAIRRSSGEYIKFIHHDDWLNKKNSLEQFVKALDDNPNISFAFCATNICDPNQNILYLNDPSTKDLLKLHKNPLYLFPNNIIGAPSATIYRSKLNKQFDEKFIYVVDIDFYLSILANSDFVYLPEYLICCSLGNLGQITLECQDDREINLFEWIYLYKKNSKKLLRFHHLFFIWSLFNKYNVLSRDDLWNVGITDPIPRILKIMMILRRFKLYWLKLNSE